MRLLWPPSQVLVYALILKEIHQETKSLLKFCCAQESSHSGGFIACLVSCKDSCEFETRLQTPVSR